VAVLALLVAVLATRHVASLAHVAAVFSACAGRTSTCAENSASPARPVSRDRAAQRLVT
jgi:hypothetical protein